MANENNLLLSIKDLIVEYSSDGKIIHAVNGVSLDLESKKTLGLVGETGAGKTTIAEAIMRILPNPPAKIKSGEIRFKGRNIMEMNNHELREIRGNKISMVFQDPMTALNPVMRVGKQVAEAIRYHNNISNQEANERALKILEMVGISKDRFMEYPHQFSGGMKQRVVIAIALASNPELLLADEPTTALDVTIQAQVLEMMSRLKNERDMSMILITHDLGIVAETCDDVAVVYGGEIIEYGTKEDIFDHAIHPYTLGLFKALPDLNTDTERLTPIDGMPPNPAELPEGCHFNPRCPYATDECKKEKIGMVSLAGKHQCRCNRLNSIAAEKEV